MSEYIKYAEKRTINIGNYESQSFSLEISRTHQALNNVDTTIEISHQEQEKLDISNMNQQVLAIMKNTKKLLDAKEVDIRSKSAKYTDFKTLDKAIYFRIIDWVKLKLRVEKIQQSVDEEFEEMNNEDF